MALANGAVCERVTMHSSSGSLEPTLAAMTTVAPASLAADDASA